MGSTDTIQRNSPTEAKPFSMKNLLLRERTQHLYDSFPTPVCSTYNNKKRNPSRTTRAHKAALISGFISAQTDTSLWCWACASHGLPIYTSAFAGTYCA